MNTLLFRADFVSMIGSIIAFFGSVILALSLGRVFWELRFALMAISASMESLARNGNLVIFTGLEKGLGKALKKSKMPTAIGLALLCISMFVQGFSLYLNSNTTDNVNSRISNIKSTLDNNVQSSAKALNELRLNDSETKEKILQFEGKIKNVSNSNNDMHDQLEKINKIITNHTTSHFTGPANSAVQ